MTVYLCIKLPVFRQPFGDWQFAFGVFQSKSSTHQRTKFDPSTPVMKFTRALDKTVATFYGFVTVVIRAAFTPSAPDVIVTVIDVTATFRLAAN
jgi:hypothetical protein